MQIDNYQQQLKASSQGQKQRNMQGGVDESGEACKTVRENKEI